LQRDEAPAFRGDCAFDRGVAFAPVGLVVVTDEHRVRGQLL